MIDVYLVWSVEHDAWWAPARQGYTRSVADAGRYTRDEAREIVRRANVVHCEECMIPVECVAWSFQLEEIAARMRALMARIDALELSHHGL